MKTGVENGIDTERRCREIAATLGVADFVYTAPASRKGSALREVAGDGLLVVGDLGAVLQVKARCPEEASLDSPEKAQNWTRKNAFKARSQGGGAKREIERKRRSGTPLEVEPLRAATLPADLRLKYRLGLTMDVSAWPTVVVVDHPSCPPLDLGFEPDTIWITLDDWTTLHTTLRSTFALLRYFRLVLHSKLHVALGCETERYVALQSEHPEFPRLDDRAPASADFFRDVIEKVWPHDGPLPWESADQYRRIVEFLDRVPIGWQAVLGSWFFEKRSEVAQGRDRSTGLASTEPNSRLIYGCSRTNNAASWSAEFTGLTALRHTEAMEEFGSSDFTTLGIGVTVHSPMNKPGVSYQFIMLKGYEGEMPMPPDIRKSLEFRFGRHVRGETLLPRIGRNEKCPCTSGKKFKHCCRS